MTVSSEIRERAGRMKWFHALDLGAFQTSGRFPEGTPQNRTLFPAMDLLQHVDFRGLDCLDIGTVHGLMAFSMKLRGASRVTATDVMDVCSPPWELARAALNLDVEYATETTIENILERLAGRQFDVIVCAGVIYHMLNPCDAVVKCRRLLKPNGLLVLESAYLAHEPRALMDFNPVEASLPETTTYWMPSRSAMLGMLRLAGFDPLAERSITKPDRLAIMARNVAWSEVRERSDLMVRMHERGLYAAGVEAEPHGQASQAAYTGPLDTVQIDWRTYQPDWPPHPREMQDVVGRTA